MQIHGQQREAHRMEIWKSNALPAIRSKWRTFFIEYFFISQYVVTLEEYLSELRNASIAPEKQVMDEYARGVAFLKGLNITEKLVPAPYKTRLIFRIK